MAQNYQIKMSLMFDTNTSKAKASLQDLQKSLNQLTRSIDSGDLKLTTDIQEAYIEAEKLKKVLNESVNINTGQFDLSKFQHQLKQSGLSVQSLSENFAKAGAQGVQAFNSLTSAIVNAEIPTKRVNKILDQMVKSLKDTLRWQISSSVIHGLTGALQSAYGYAQDLNKSLNDIRIVTGYSEEHMANFAKEANKAAKALSSTTNEYTKAALIFYQQGTLTESQIAQRTEAVIKMANVTGESAKDISSYMTAIWNNFDDGTKSIEYYADVITALGAATASSSEEIATGMQQFAAIGKTVGLSYDYAASALATVVAATRQSEETVGTSFKTIFSRLQSLSLGETLEDDTTLTKYSAALAKVGINIKTDNYELKSMDVILDELGKKWKDISADQKNALAYTVAGSRQYTNFIALLDNYDTFKINVDIAEESEGTLEEQQKIYAESWEAAANRVRAAAEGIFDDLIDDKFFIKLLNGAEKLLSILDLFMDSIGGLPGVLSLVSSLMLKIFNSQITQSVRDIGYGLSHFLGIAQAKAGKTKTEFSQEAQKLTKQMRIDVVGDPILNSELDSMAYRTQLEQEYISLESTLTDRQKEQYQVQLSLLDVMRQQKKEKMEAIALAQEEMQKAGVTAVKKASIVSEGKFVSPKKLEQISKIHDSSIAFENADKNLYESEQSLYSKQAQLDILQDELDSAQIKRDQLVLKHSAASKRKGVGFGNTNLSQSGASRDQDVQLSRELSAADSLVQELEKKVAIATEAVSAAYEEVHKNKESFYEALVTKLEASEEEVFEPPVDIGQTLQKYITYSTGRNEMLEKGIIDMLEGVSDISPDNMSEEYKQKLQDIAIELSEFRDDYYVELGENTQQIIEDIIQQLETTWNENGVDISSIDINKYIDEIRTSSAQDSAKYGTGVTNENGRVIRQGRAEDIRAAMKDQYGIVFDDESFANFEKSYKKYSKTIRDLRKITEEELKGTQNAFDNLHVPDEHLFDFAERITGIAQGFTNLTLAINSVKGAWDAISNPDLSGWEKFMSVFTALSTVIGSVMSIMQIVSKLKSKENEKTAKETIITWLNTIAQKANAKARKEVGDSADQQGKKIDKVTQEKQEEIITDSLEAGVKKATNETGKGIGGTETGTGISSAAKGLGAEGQTLGEAFKAVLPALKSAASVIAPIAIAVAAIAATAIIIVNIYQAAEKEAKKAEKQAESLKEIAEEAKQEYQDTIDTISNYEDALDGIDKLTKGTQEWKDAIVDANEQAKELIDKFGTDLQAGDYYFEDGQIKFKEGVLENLQAKEYEAMMQAQAGADSANIVALQKRDKADTIEFARKNMRTGQSSQETSASISAGALGGAVAGAAIGSFIPLPVIGTAIGAVAGTIVGTIGAAIGTGIAGAASEAEQEAISKLTDEYRKDSTIIDKMAQAQKAGTLDKFAEQYGISEQLANSLLDNKDATEELIKQLASNANEMQLLRESIAANTNAGKEAYEQAENPEFINARIANLMQNSESAEYKQAQAKIDELFKGSNQDFWELYLEKVIGDKENYRIKNQLGGNVTLQKLDENGNWVTDETLGKNGLSEADAIAALRNVLVADLSPEDIEAIDTEERELTKSLQNAGISDKKIAQKATKASEAGEEVDLSSLTKTQLDNLNLEAITNKKLAADIQQAQENAKESWDAMLEDFYRSTQIAVNNLDTSSINMTQKFSREQLEAYGMALDQLGQIGGDKVIDAFNVNLTNLLEQNQEAANQIMTIIMGIDWSNPEEGLLNFQNELSNIGISIDVMSWETEELGKTFGEIDFSPAFLTNLDKVNNKLSTFSQILKDLKTDDIISEDEYLKILESFPEYANLFIKTIEGYQFQGKTGEFNDISRDTLINAIQDTQDILNFNKNEYDNLDDDKTRLKFFNELLNNKSLLQSSGLNEEQVQEYIKILNKGNPYLRSATELAIDSVSSITAANSALKSILEKQEGMSNEDLVSYQKQYSTTLTSKEALDKAKEEGLITEGQYNDRIIGINNLLEALKEEIDIYEDEEFQIESINKQLENQEEITEKLHGDDKLKSLKQELQLQKQLLKVNQESLKTAQKSLENEYETFLEKAEQQYGNEFINKIKRNELGEIINWEELYNYIIRIGETDLSIFNEYKTILTEASESVEKYTDAIKENADEIDSYWARYAEAIAENYDFISNKQEELKSQAESYRDIIELLGKETLNINNDELKKINDSMLEISKIELQNSYQTYIDQRKARLRAEQAYNKNQNETTKKALEEAQDLEAEALQEMNEKWSSALEQASQILQDNISFIMKDFENSIAGIYGSFEYMSNLYSQQSELSNQYLADYKKIYELNKLSKNIQNSIDSNNSIKSKQMLNELQQELNTLQQDGVKISEYDLNYLQKKYDLKLAEIALEESQNAKNQVRLQKMANGSWGYIYTQNEEAITQAQQSYEDKLYNLQDLNVSYLDTVSQQIINTQSEFEAAITDIYNSGLSPEEQKQRIDETVEYYKGRLQFLTTEFDKVIENNEGLQDMVQSFSETLLGSLYPEDYANAESIYEIFIKNLDGEDGLLKQLENASLEYSKTIEDIFEATNKSVDNFSENITKQIDQIALSVANLNENYKDKILFKSKQGNTMSQLDVMSRLINRGYFFNKLSTLDEKELAELYKQEFGTPTDVNAFVMEYVYGQSSKFDTGGYTGEWGPSGKLAVLHEKEIVLNAQDTQNLLKTMEIMDQLIKNIELQALSAALDSLTAPLVQSNEDTIQQEVTIHAEFPNAVDHSEIEQAFNSLVNRAAQYANRNR